MADQAEESTSVQEASAARDSTAARAIAARFADAVAQHRKGRMDAAIAGYGSILRDAPEHTDAYNNLGVALRAKGHFAVAVACYRRALALSPKDAGTHSNLGNALRALGRLDEAEACHRRALVLNADYLDARYNLGLVLKDQGRLDEAISCLSDVVRHDPDHVDAHWDRALAWLLSGDLARGFAEYEWRWRLLENRPRRFNRPMWDGTALDGRIVLIHAEQGFGDTIQFARFAPLVTGRGGHPVLEAPPTLAALLATLDGATVVARGGELPAFDLHAPLLSLPRILGTTTDTIPAPERYLRPPAAAGAALANAIAAAPGGMRIGIAWAGKPTHRNDRNRSAGIEPFITLLGTCDRTFFGLQIGPRAEDIARSGCGALVRDLSPYIRDFADTAAAVAEMDLIITVDTALAHLAGALGKRVWVLLPHNPDWRWLMAREDSRWYPSMRLFRQSRFGDWAGVLERVGAALNDETTA